MIKYRKRGFTLIELIVVIGLSAIILTIFGSYVSRGFTSYRMQEKIVEEQEKISSVLREFEKNTRAATEILTANNHELEYYRFFDFTSSYPKQVRYFIVGNSLKVGVTEPHGVAPAITYPPANEQIELVITNVVNPTTVFTYYNGVNSLITEPINITNVKMVMMTISLDSDPNSPPATLTELTKVSLRNLKDNL